MSSLHDRVAESNAEIGDLITRGGMNGTLCTRQRRVNGNSQQQDRSCSPEDEAPLPLQEASLRNC